MSAQSLKNLQISLSVIDALLQNAAAEIMAAGSDPNDTLRGLIISPEEFAEQLGRAPLSAWWEHPESHNIHIDLPAGAPLTRLVDAFNLSNIDTIILLLCLAPELDRRYERMYSYLQDDVSLRRASTSLMMNLIGNDLHERFSVWERLQNNAPLIAHRLVIAQPDSSRPNSTPMSYPLLVEPRLINYLLGDTTPDARLKSAVWVEKPASPQFATPLEAAQRLWLDAPMVILQGADSYSQRSAASALSHEMGAGLVCVDALALTKLGLHGDSMYHEIAWRIAIREGYLNDAALLIDGWETAFKDATRSDERGEIEVPREVWAHLIAYPKPIFISHAGAWEPLDVERTRRILRIDFESASYEERRDLWYASLGVKNNGNGAHAQLDELAEKFRFTPAQTARAVNSAADYAATRGDTIQVSDLYAGAQAQASLRLGRLAERVPPRATWDNLILPPEQITQLQEITARARFAHVVHEDWGFSKQINARGVSALFAGESGTGKTLAAEVIANALGLPLYTIDISAVVSKYIGETEKNLRVIFEEADASSAILFFDEADAIFGKRSEVKDARDRYANIEIAYLLQKIEQYDGVAILATNLRQNIDEAFTRRIDFLIDFPFPDAEYRLRLWQAHFPTQAPLAQDIDLNYIADQYRLAGGNIRNAAIAAAFLAATDGSVIGRVHLQGAIRREHQKMGRLIES